MTQMGENGLVGVILVVRSSEWSYQVGDLRAMIVAMVVCRKDRRRVHRGTAGRREGEGRLFIIIIIIQWTPTEFTVVRELNYSDITQR